jgi:ABC-type glycerol-3-phosphate transport system substrate-binding protein
MDRNTWRGRGGRLRFAGGLLMVAGLAVAACGDDEAPAADTGGDPVVTTVAGWGDEHRDPLASNAPQWGDEQREPQGAP